VSRAQLEALVERRPNWRSVAVLLQSVRVHFFNSRWGSAKFIGGNNYVSAHNILAISDALDMTLPREIADCVIEFLRTGADAFLLNLLLYVLHGPALAVRQKANQSAQHSPRSVGRDRAQHRRYFLENFVLLLEGKGCQKELNGVSDLTRRRAPTIGGLLIVRNRKGGCINHWETMT
jgi:hypothetical protein